MRINYKHSQETKKKISLSKKGCIAWNKGISCVGHLQTEKTRKKISQSHFGIKQTPESIEKISESLKQQWAEGKRKPRKIYLSNSGSFKKGEHTGKNHWRWNGGSSFEPYSISFNQQLKDRIRVRDNFICQICGVPELECEIRLNIHHIDYNKKNCKGENLISLCHSCHTKTGFNRKYWENFLKQKVRI